MKAEFITSVVKPTSWPPAAPYEIALFGRSNVGKSTFLNTLTKHRGLARVSRTPGRTRAANFFLWQGKIHLVDLPGYGFAVKSKEDEDWQSLVLSYLEQKRASLCLFIFDLRRKVGEDDLWVLNALKKQQEIWIIFSKGDKLNRAEGTRLRKEFDAQLAQAKISVTKSFLLSASTSTGWEEVRAAIQALKL